MHFYPLAVSDAVILSIIGAVGLLGSAAFTAVSSIIITMLTSSHQRQDVAAVKLDQIHEQTNGNLSAMQAKIDELQAENKKLLAMMPPPMATAAMNVQVDPPLKVQT